MAVFLSSGHHNRDSGAVNKGLGRQENKEAIKLTEAVTSEIKRQRPDIKVINDRNEETLREYLDRIKTGSGSVVLENHFDSFSETSTGTTSIIPDDYDENDFNFALDLSRDVSAAMGIRNRGAITEKKSNRGRLGLMRKKGIVSLLEVCFISNKNDMDAYDRNFDKVVQAIVKNLIKYEDLIK